MANKPTSWPTSARPEESQIRELCYVSPKLEGFPRMTIVLKGGPAWGKVLWTVYPELIQKILLSLRAGQDWPGQNKPQEEFLNNTGQSLFKKKKNLTTVQFLLLDNLGVFFWCIVVRESPREADTTEITIFPQNWVVSRYWEAEG